MKALVLLADGTEEMEAVIICDILARAGITVVRAAVENKDNLILKCANGMKIVADVALETEMSKLDDFSIIVLPGGKSAGQIIYIIESVLGQGILGRINERRIRRIVDQNICLVLV